MQKPNPNSDPDPVKPGRYRSRRRGSMSPTPGPHPVTPTKRKAESPPGGTNIAGVHRLSHEIWAIEPGLSLHSFKELRSALPKERRNTIFDAFLEFQHDRLFTKMTVVKTAYQDNATTDNDKVPAPQARETFEKIVEQHLLLLTELEAWESIIEYLNKTHYHGNEQTWPEAPKLRKLADRLNNLQEKCDLLIKQQEDAHLKDLLSFGERPVETTETPETPETRHKVPEPTPSPPPPSTPPRGPRVPEPTTSPESEGGTPSKKSTGVGPGSKYKSWRKPQELPGPPVPPKRGTQGGRAQKRRSLVVPSQTMEKISGILERLVDMHGNRQKARIEDLRGALIETFEAGDEWFVFNVDHSPEDKEGRSLPARIAEDNEVNKLAQEVDAYEISTASLERRRGSE